MGIGSYPAISLSRAREKAAKIRTELAEGKDPFRERRAERIKAQLEAGKEISFQECVERFVEAKKAAWKSVKHATDWPNSLELHAYPVFKDLPVGLIEVSHILRVLDPIWRTKTETASRLRGRIEQVLGWAKVQGYRQGDNPARWKENLDQALPAPSKFKKVEHFPALPYAEVGAFMAELRTREGVGAKALELVILTCTRTTEVREATWDEVNVAEKVWTIPPERMKSGSPHRIPLSKAAVAVLEIMAKLGTKGLIFPGPTPKEPMSNNAMLSVLDRMGHGHVTVHGFRSTFSDWAEDTTNYPPAVIDRALSHSKKEKTQKAYFRTDLFERRAPLMEEWAKYCGTVKEPGEVVAIRRVG